MKFIRVFLWVLVGAMTLQGILQADEYGSAPSMMGGVGLTMSVWRESLWDGAKNIFGATSSYVPLPRALVVAALAETARHPGIETLPQLKQVLSTHRRTWKIFRDMEVEWMLTHTNLIGALVSERRDLWAGWHSAATAAAEAVEISKAEQCWVQLAGACAQKKMATAQLESEARRLNHIASLWDRILAMDPTVSVVEWWNVTYGRSDLLAGIEDFHRRLSLLHDIDTPTNSRVKALKMEAALIAGNLGLHDTTLEMLVEGILMRDLWNACLSHIRAREGRIQELMIAAGVQDMFNAYERVMNASLRVVQSQESRDTVQNWFGEMLGYAWWLGDDIPGIVRRCVAHDAGDCLRIGPTEIVTLSDQMSERSRILEDWIRRLFIGMWNALPALFVLFVVEMIMICLPRGPVNDRAKEIYEIVEVPARGRIVDGVDSRRLARKRLTLQD